MESKERKMKVSISNEVFEITDEQLEKIKAIVGQEFEPITVCHLVIRPRLAGGVDFYRTDSGQFICGQTVPEAKRTIKAIQATLDFKP